MKSLFSQCLMRNSEILVNFWSMLFEMNAEECDTRNAFTHIHAKQTTFHPLRFRNYEIDEKYIVYKHNFLCLSLTHSHSHTFRVPCFSATLSTSTIRQQIIIFRFNYYTKHLRPAVSMAMEKIIAFSPNWFTCARRRLRILNTLIIYSH